LLADVAIGPDVTSGGQVEVELYATDRSINIIGQMYEFSADIAGGQRNVFATLSSTFEQADYLSSFTGPDGLPVYGDNLMIGIDTIFYGGSGSIFIDNVRLVVTYPQSPGDANGDGAVDINDLSVLLTNFDKTGMVWSQGDFDGNGTVDISDLSQLLTNFDKTVGAAAGITAVPEPGALTLLAAGLVGLFACAWRKYG
jgi:hypothetical protein